MQATHYQWVFLGSGLLKLLWSIPSAVHCYRANKRLSEEMNRPYGFTQSLVDNTFAWSAAIIGISFLLQSRFHAFEPYVLPLSLLVIVCCVPLYILGRRKTTQDIYIEKREEAKETEYRSKAKLDRHILERLENQDLQA